MREEMAGDDREVRTEAPGLPRATGEEAVGQDEVVFAPVVRPYYTVEADRILIFGTPNTDLLPDSATDIGAMIRTAHARERSKSVREFGITEETRATLLAVGEACDVLEASDVTMAREFVVKCLPVVRNNVREIHSAAYGVIKQKDETIRSQARHIVALEESNERYRRVLIDAMGEEGYRVWQEAE